MVRGHGQSRMVASKWVELEVYRISRWLPWRTNCQRNRGTRRDKVEERKVKSQFLRRDFDGKGEARGNLEIRQYY